MKFNVKYQHVSSRRDSNSHYVSLWVLSIRLRISGQRSQYIVRSCRRASACQSLTQYAHLIRRPHHRLQQQQPDYSHLMLDCWKDRRSSAVDSKSWMRKHGEWPAWNRWRCSGNSTVHDCRQLRHTPIHVQADKRCHRSDLIKHPVSTTLPRIM